MKVQNFEDLRVFQMARELCKCVYAVTDSLPWKSDTRFVQQIHAAAGSVMDNIAEGFERDGNKEFLNFLYIAKGSCGEVRSQLIRAHDLNFISDEKYNDLYEKCTGLGKGIAGLINSIKKSNITGLKNKPLETKN